MGCRPGERAFFLLPLREKVARTKSVPDEGFYPRATCPLRQPLAQANLVQAPVMPSPAGGEGVATGAGGRANPTPAD
jgi:hypothetical protein